VPKPPAPDPPPSASDEAEFRARLAERRRKGQERLETVRRELAEEDKAASQAAEALRKRLSSRPVTLSALEGRTYPKATIRRYTLYDAEIEAGGKVESISWDALTPDSIAAAAAALFDPGSAADQFERGRYFIARRRWKEAREAFEQAAKLDPGLDPRVAEFRDTLERLITGQGPFQGSARRAGADGLLLRYDFREAKQLEDFTPGLAHEAGRAVLDSAAAKEGVVLKGDSDIPVVFISELSLEGRFTAEGPVVLGLFDGPKRGYELEIGPEGTALSRLDAAAPDRRKPVGRSAQAKLTPGKTHHLRVFVKNWRFTVSIDRKEPAAFEDPPPPGPADILEGVLRIATAKGKLRIEAPLLVQGRLEAAELEKRVGETEVMVRRALDPDLEEVRVRREYRMALGMLSTGENLVLSADDRRFSWRIKTNEDLVVYEGLKKGLVSYLNGSPTVGFSLAAWEADVSKLIGRYPDVPALHYLRSVARAESQDGAAAREDLRKALELFPEFHEALTLQSRQHLSEGDLQGALSAANRALDLMPDSAEARVARALATFSRSPAAEDSFTEDLKIARRLDPHGSEAGTWLRVLVRQVRGPRDLGCRFEHETANYRISTDISPEAARRYGEALEAARRHFLETFRHLATPAPGRKPRVAIFNTAENYYTYNEILSETRAEHTGGVFRSTLNELVLFELLDETETLHTLFHEAFHHFMHQILLDTPPYWFNEGLADYMGALAVQGGKVVRKGLVVPDRQFAARLLLELNRTFPFEKLMLDTPRDFYGPDSWLKYAQAWSMVHFFYEAGGGKHRGLIEDYFKALRARKSPREAYDAVFAPRVSALEAEWKQHVRAVK
jgi:tetratricopeptide (TPR) repeat protein